MAAIFTGFDSAAVFAAAAVFTAVGVPIVLATSVGPKVGSRLVGWVQWMIAR